MRFLPLLLISCIVAGADIPSLIAEHDKTVAAADAKLVKALVAAVKTAKDPDKPDLYKLIAKYDPSNADAQKFLAASGGGTEKNDPAGASLQTITQANAALLIKGYGSDKISAKDWDGFPGVVVTVDAGKGPNDSKIEYSKGEVLFIAPNPEDKWGSSAPGGVVTTFKGNGSGPSGDYFTMIWTVDSGTLGQATNALVVKQYLVTSEYSGKLWFKPSYDASRGTIRVKIMKVTEK